MSGPHFQLDSRRFGVFAGAWWRRWAFGLIASRDDEGDISAALCLGPFYVGIGFR